MALEEEERLEMKGVATARDTNMDTYSNKKAEFEARVSLLKPDIIGLTEIKPKNSVWNLDDQYMTIQNYTVYTNLTGRGTALYVKNSIC